MNTGAESFLSFVMHHYDLLSCRSLSFHPGHEPGVARAFSFPLFLECTTVFFFRYPWPHHVIGDGAAVGRAFARPRLSPPASLFIVFAA